MAKGLAAVVLFFAATAGASALERSLFQAGAPVKATCSCKGKGDCTCPKGQCRCKNCGNGARLKLMESLQGNTANTRLPDTARGEARGGVAI